MPVPLVPGLAGAFAAVVGTGWFLRHRRAPMASQSVRATPSEGPPVQLSVRPAGTDTTHTVRIEPHPDAGVTTIEEERP